MPLVYDDAAGKLKDLIFPGASDTTMAAVIQEIGGVSSSTRLPPATTFLLSASGTYTPPVGALWLDVELWGPGGPGAGSGTTPGLGTVSATDTTFGSLTASKGLAPANTTTGGLGGTGTGGDNNVTGQNGGNVASGYTQQAAGFGGGPLGAPSYPQSTGVAAPVNSGCGGAGSGSNTVANGGPGGGQGGYTFARISSIAASYSYNVGPASTGGTAGTSGFAGGAGASGQIKVTAYFQ